MVAGAIFDVGCRHCKHALWRVDDSAFGCRQMIGKQRLCERRLLVEMPLRLAARRGAWSGRDK